MICDRLGSYLSGVDALPRDQRFVRLVSSWRASLEEPISYKFGADLSKDVDEWRKQRNMIIHGLVKSAPGKPTQNVDDFLGLAKLAAENGAALARAACDWHKRAARKK